MGLNYYVLITEENFVLSGALNQNGTPALYRLALKTFTKIQSYDLELHRQRC
jgi:hypothetical protein